MKIAVFCIKLLALILSSKELIVLKYYTILSFFFFLLSAYLTIMSPFVLAEKSIFYNQFKPGRTNSMLDTLHIFMKERERAPWT